MQRKAATGAGLALVIAGVTSGTPALAEEVATSSSGGHMGRTGRVILTAENLFGYNTFTSSREGRDSSHLSSLSFLGGGSVSSVVGIRPPYLGLHLVPVENLTLGLNFAFASFKIGDNSDTSTLLSVAPRVGYALPVGAHAIWLRGGVTYTSFGADRKSTLLHATLDPQFVIAAASHFGVMIGGVLDLPLGNTKSDGEDTKSKVTALGLNVGLLGHFLAPMARF